MSAQGVRVAPPADHEAEPARPSDLHLGQRSLGQRILEHGRLGRVPARSPGRGEGGVGCGWYPHRPTSGFTEVSSFAPGHAESRKPVWEGGASDGYQKLEVSMLEQQVRTADAGPLTKDKLSIIMFSGTADKFIPLGVLAQAATAMGTEVDIFVTGFALLGFTREHHELPFPAEFATMAPNLAQGMEANRVESWDKMLRQAKELGATVHACSMMSGVMGLTQSDYNDLVDDIVGAASFLQAAAGGQTLFI